jgi:hypothetical protein
MESSEFACRNGNAASAVAQAPRLAEDHAAHQATPAAPAAGSKLGRRALLAGLGSALVSVLGFGALTLFEQYNGLVSEMRADLKHFNETAGEYVKRDSFQRYRDQMKERLKELQESKFAKAQLEQELKASEKAREETAAELQRMRERLAFLEGRHAATASRKEPGD